MADDVTKQINVVATSKGFDQLLNTLKLSEASLKQLHRDGKITDDQFERVSKSAGRMATEVRKVAGAQKQATEATQKSTTAQRNLNKTINDALALEDRFAQRRRESARAADQGRQQRDASIRSYDQEVQAGIRARLEREAMVQSTQKANNATAQMAGNLPRLRYALYDVSTTLAFTGAAMTGLATATALASVTMDRQFADVVRTTGTYTDATGQQTAALRDEFNNLFSTLPKSWADITNIGTLAGQLGIATENVAEFTSLVAKFASVTDVTVDASATAFGRLSQLLDVTASEYENLGSSILAVGVSSVATESQIINISSQIASMGAFAGLSADEVIGFSSALASLGVQPELSRGTITRLFTNIASAVDNGGEKLDSFAALADRSAGQFADAWRTDASEAIMLVLRGLEEIDSAGGSAITALREVGITSVRDVPTLLKLAQNYGFVAEQLNIASDGYAEGTALQEQYGVIAETTAEKLTLLTNNIKLFVASLGETDGVLATVIEGVTTFVRGLAELAQNDIVQAVTGTSLAITALGGVVLIAVGGMARFFASTIAVKTAMQDMATTALASGHSLRGLSTQADIASASTAKLAFAIRGVRTALISTGIGAALVAVGSAIAYFVGEADKANAARQALSEAIKTDTDAGNGIEITTNRVVDLERATENVAISQEAWNRILDGSSTYSEEYAAAVDVATSAVKDFQALAGDATRKELLGMFQDSSAIKDAFQEGFLPEDLDFSDLTDIFIQEGEAGAQAYLDSMFNPEQMRAERERIAQQLGELVRFVGDPTGAKAEGLTPTQMDQLRYYEGLTARLEAYNHISAEVTNTQGQYATAVEDAAYAQRVLAGETDNASDAAQGAGDSAAFAADGYEDLTASAESATEAIFGMINVQSGLNSALYELGQSVYENGQNFDSFSASGRENLEALQNVFSATADFAAANGVTFEEAMKVVGGAMVQAGVISVEQLRALGVEGVNFGNVLLATAEATSRAVAALQNQMAALQAADSGLTRGQAADGLRYAGQALAVVEGGGENATKAIESMGIQFERLQVPGLELNGLMDQISSGWDDAGESASRSGGRQSKAGKDAAKGAKEAAQEVRTLSDYVSDLETVLADAFQFRFGFQEAKDDGADAFQAIRDRIEEARLSVRNLNQSIRETKATIAGLGADRQILQYQLGVAIEYGDDLRAAEIRAELKENSADLSDAENDLTDAQKDLNKQQQILTLSLTDNNEASRENRDLVLAMVQAYQKQITEYVNTGASQEEVRRYTERLTDKFRKQLTQLGYNRREVDRYAAAFRDTKKVLDKMPKNLTLRANTDPAQRAMDEFRASARKANDSLNSLRRNAGRSIPGPRFSGPSTGGLSRTARAAQLEVELISLLKAVKSTNYAPAIATYSRRIDEIERLLRSGSFATGGYTGRGGKYEYAGAVHKGEYVIPKHEVNQATGLPYADALQRLTRGTPSPQGYANGGYAAMPATMVVELGPKSLRAVKEGGQVVVQMDGRAVTQVVNDNNRNFTGVLGRR